MALTKITPQMFDTSAAGHDLNVDNGTFVVDASANRVGIGTTTPSTLLDVNGALTVSGDLTVDTNTLKVESSNNRVLVGKSSTGLGNAGVEFEGGQIKGTSANQIIQYLNRTGSNGDILELRKDNTIVSKIGARSGVVSYIVLDPRTSVKGAALIGGSIDANTGIINPGKNDGDITDGALNLGTASSRFKDAHFSGNITGTLTTAAQTNITSVGTLTGLTLSGVALISDGSNSSPAIGFANDTDTGILRVTTNALGITAGGSRKFYVNATNGYFQNLSKVQIDSGDFYVDGDVGIGVASPAQALDVAGTIQSTVGLRVAGHPVVGYSSITGGYAANLGSTGSSTLNETHIYSGGNLRAVFNGSGKLLHGTNTVPTGVLLGNQLVSSSATGAEIIAFRADTSVAVGDKTGAFLLGNSDTDGAEDHFVGMYGKVISTNGSQNLHFVAGRAGYEGDTPDMTIESGGNVGIGTTNPAHSIHVRGPVSTTGGVIAAFDATDSTNTWMQLKNSNSGNSWQIGATDAGIRFYNDETAGYSSLTIAANGNIGIGTGTTAPTEALEVAGNIKATGSSRFLLPNFWIGPVPNTANNNNGAVLLVNLTTINANNVGFQFSGSIIANSYTGQAYLNVNIVKHYTTDAVTFDVSGDSHLSTFKTQLNLCTVTYSGNSYLAIVKNGGGTGTIFLNGYFQGWYPSQVTEVTSGNYTITTNHGNLNF